MAGLAGDGAVVGDAVTAYLVIVAGFAGLLVAAVVVEGLGRAGRGPFAPLARVLAGAMVPRTGRLIVGATWLWIGFHFLAR